MRFRLKIKTHKRNKFEGFSHWKNYKLQLTERYEQNTSKQKTIHVESVIKNNCL